MDVNDYNITVIVCIILSDPSSVPDTSRPAGCRVYATVKEMSTGRHFTICGGYERTRHVYITTSHHIQIRIIGQTEEDQTGRFLLHYQGE